MTEERYEIRGKLGQGGLGAVYRAYDKNLNREVAIKRVLPDGETDDEDEATSSLLKEAKALSAIQHPHIVTVYDCGLDEDGPFVVMEILEGRTIEEMVGQGTLVWEDFREVVMQTQEALIAAQDLDLVHRDLKPGNIMVIWLPSGKFQIKLVDFGLAKFSPTPSLQTMDHGHAVFGSIYFMAPEQFERRPLDQRTDMYAMGAIYYYTLTGEYPFDGDTAPQVMAAHLQHKVTPLSEVRPDVPDWACEWVMWHIERDMDNRPANARESLQRFLALEKQANGSPAPAGATGPQFVQPGTAAVQTTGQNSGRVQLRTGPVAVSGQTGPQAAPANTGEAMAGQTTGQQLVGGAVPTSTPVVGLPEVPKKKLLENKVFLVAVVAGLMVLIIIVASLLNSESEEQEAKANVMEIIELAKKENSAELTTAQVEAVLRFYVGDDPNWASAAVPLNLAKGGETDAAIAKFIINEKIAPDRRKHLIDIAKVRDSDVIAKAFVEGAVNAGDYAVAADLLSAVSKKISPVHTRDLVRLFSESDSQRLNSVLEPIIQRLIRQDGSGGVYEAEFVNQHVFLAPTDPGKASAYLRLAAGTGSSDALKIVKQKLNEGDLADKRVAIAALGVWPNDKVFQTFTNLLSDLELPDGLRRDAFKSTLQLLKDNKDRSVEDSERMWGELTRIASSRKEKMALMNAMSTVRGNWVDDILMIFEGDSDNEVSYRAEILLEKREENLQGG